MLNELLANIGQYISINPWLAMVAVFVGGLITASNPCVLAMIPLMISFVAGCQEEESSIFKSFILSLMFVIGLAITFTSLGMIAALAGKIYGDVSVIWHWVVAFVCIVMGLHLAGVLHVTIPMPVTIKPKAKGVLGALVLGLLFGFVSAPCAAPILVVLLTYLAGSKSSILYGGLLLLLYALGHSVLILIAGTSMGVVKKIISSNRATKALGLIRQFSGGVIILIGIFFIFQALQ